MVVEDEIFVQPMFSLPPHFGKEQGSQGGGARLELVHSTQLAVRSPGRSTSRLSWPRVNGDVLSLRSPLQGCVSLVDVVARLFTLRGWQQAYQHRPG